MRIMINASNLKQGGGIQVADSICRYLVNYRQHHFVVVLPPIMEATRSVVSEFPNVSVVTYGLNRTLASLFCQKDAFLDSIVSDRKVDAVLTVFGPSRWKPSVPHLCGFARAHILPMDTPYFSRISFKDRIVNSAVKRSFRLCSDFYWTENPSVSELLGRVFPEKKVFTVSNNYNQVYDEKSRWKEHLLPPFKGTTLLTVTNSYPHKNLTIAIQIAEYLKRNHPGFSFRFVYTINEKEFPPLSSEMRDHFVFLGPVDVSECPSLYLQSDIMFQPSLLECFSATYPEAMKMGVPIVTTDLPFARGLCGDAALYYSSLSAEEAAERIYDLSTNEALARNLIDSGTQQLGHYLSAEQRAAQLVELIESIV